MRRPLAQHPRSRMGHQRLWLLSAGRQEFAHSLGREHYHFCFGVIWPREMLHQTQRTGVGMLKQWTASLVLVGALGIVAAAAAEKQYAPGVSDTEIKIGNTMPYSGATSPYGAIGKSEAAYFAMINDQGGINGRKINFISRDDASSPPKTLEMVRKLVEEDQVLLMFGPLGTPPNTAIWSYLNENKVPQLFVTSGAEKFNDPKNHPWTMGWLPSYRIESRIYARYILEESAGREDRGAVRERRFRQGLSHWFA